jgi:hypothetical protein
MINNKEKNNQMINNKVPLSFPLILTFGFENLGKNQQESTIKYVLVPTFSLDIEIWFRKHKEK